jgi:hypothetical protein
MKAQTKALLCATMVGMAGLGVSGAIAQPGLAQPAPKPYAIDLEVYPALERTMPPANSCPQSVTVSQQSQPYREGSYAVDGVANLKGLASNFTMATSDDFSVTWVGQLNPRYRQCKATARMVKSDGNAYKGHSYLRLRFNQGKLYLILDMTGVSDANNYTLAITRKAIQNGNPVWTWSGSD